jgi:hypothetical protein
MASRKQVTRCGLVILTSADPRAYVIGREMVVSQRLVLQGNRALLPYLDCRPSDRCFRVVVGPFIHTQDQYWPRQPALANWPQDQRRFAMLAPSLLYRFLPPPQTHPATPRTHTGHG